MLRVVIQTLRRWIYLPGWLLLSEDCLGRKKKKVVCPSRVATSNHQCVCVHLMVGSYPQFHTILTTYSYVELLMGLSGAFVPLGPSSVSVSL